MPENPINPKYLKYAQGAYKALGGDERFTSFDNFQSQLVKDEGFRIQVYKDLGGNSVVGEQAKFDHIITLGNITYQKKKMEPSKPAVNYPVYPRQSAIGLFKARFISLIQSLQTLIRSLMTTH